MRGRTPALAFLGVLAFVLAAVPSPGSGAETNRPVRTRKVSFVALFDPNQRFKPKKTFKLRFRAKEKTSGAPVALEEISISLRHGPGKAGTPLPVRELKEGVFEVSFKPLGPGQYAVVASIRGVSAGSIPPVRLGVLGFADGIVEEPADADRDVMRHRGKSKGRLTR
jgi:hypothetical protein